MHAKKNPVWIVKVSNRPNFSYPSHVENNIHCSTYYGCKHETCNSEHTSQSDEHTNYFGTTWLYM